MYWVCGTYVFIWETNNFKSFSCTNIYSRNEGMCHALQASDWRELFDVIIVEARKPSFYSDANRLNTIVLIPSFNKHKYRISAIKRRTRLVAALE